MIRELSTLLYGVALALVLGIGSAVWATGHYPLFGELEINGWNANPGVGADSPDPYSQAYFARSGGLPLAAAAMEEEETIEGVYEPYLMQEGLLERTPRGRVATTRAYEHCGKMPNHARVFFSNELECKTIAESGKCNGCCSGQNNS